MLASSNRLPSSSKAALDAARYVTVPHSIRLYRNTVILDCDVYGSSHTTRESSRCILRVFKFISQEFIPHFLITRSSTNLFCPTQKPRRTREPPNGIREEINPNSITIFRQVLLVKCKLKQRALRIPKWVADTSTFHNASDFFNTIQPNYSIFSSGRGNSR